MPFFPRRWYCCRKSRTMYTEISSINNDADYSLHLTVPDTQKTYKVVILSENQQGIPLETIEILKGILIEGYNCEGILYILYHIVPKLTPFLHIMLDEIIKMNGCLNLELYDRFIYI